MATWLIRFGLGGVQPFIQESRKMRDFSAASALLSEICRTVAAAVPSDRKVLPIESVESEGRVLQLPSRPHQLTVRIGGDEDQVRAFGREMEKAARDWWLTEARNAVARHTITIAAEPEDVLSQLETALEIYWCAVPVPGEDGFAAAFQALGQAFDGRRYTRTFAPVRKLLKDRENWACSQCGNRPGVTGKPSSTSLPLYSKGERLCAVCLTKRHWKSGATRRTFDSTHAVARSRVRYDVGLREVRSQLHRLDECLDVDAADIDDVKAQASKSAVAPDRLRSWLEEVDSRCSSYYALVAFDGDEMGKWFAKPDKYCDGVPLEKGQRSLGEALVRFAHGLEPLVHEAGAALVYAGGDDGFMVSPLDGVLGILEAIHERWAESVASLRAVAADSLPTLTAHASIVHAKAPLQPALAQMRSLLGDAKKHGGRDAFSVLADVRAGSSATLVGKWGEFQKFRAAVEAASNWKRGDVRGQAIVDEALQKDFEREIEIRDRHKLPTRLLHTLMGAIPPFFDDADKVTFRRELENEIRRLVARSRRDAALHASTIDWFVERAGGVGDATDGVPGFAALETALQVTAFLARELSWKPIADDQGGEAPAVHEAAVVV